MLSPVRPPGCAATLSEALAPGMANGPDPNGLSEIMRRSSGGHWAVEKYKRVPGVLEAASGFKKYADGFGPDMMRKDLGVAQTSPTAVQGATQVDGLVRSLYAAHSLAGNGGMDFSSVFEVIRPRLTSKSRSLTLTSSPADTMRKSMFTSRATGMPVAAVTQVGEWHIASNPERYLLQPRVNSLQKTSKCRRHR